jgi:phosphatidylglycerol---prolipoprotein diacylglyceryl transferase
VLLASIPSPGTGQIEIGPLQLRAYGLLIALGVVAAVWLTQRRWEARGGSADDITKIAMVGVPAGLVGARLYHVATDWKRFRGDWGEVVAVWHGGLGIWGAVVGGILGGWWVARRNGLPLAPLLDAVAPALPLAQAIGRFGNYFNQELFGRPTDLPWALEIDPEHRPAGYADAATFHPTFLYEALWNLLLVAFLIWLAPRLIGRFRPGATFALYVLGYTLGRLWIELVRIDPASRVLGLRINVWTSLVGITGALVALWWLRPRRGEDAPPGPDAESDEGADDAVDAARGA